MRLWIVEMNELLSQYARVAAAILIVVFAASCVGSAGSPAETEIRIGSSVSSILDRADSDFEVVFDWKQGVPGNGQGQFFWRVHGDTVRWDAVTFAQGEPASEGVFSVWERTKEIELLPSALLSCDWVTRGTSSANAECSDSFISGPESIIGRSRLELVVEVLPSRVIAGRKSSCFVTQRRATFCIDQATYIPLYVRGEDDLVYEIEVHSVVTPLGRLVGVEELSTLLLPLQASETSLSSLDLPKSLSVGR